MLLAIIGRKNTGKSTTEKIIGFSTPVVVKRTAFAKPLKDMAKAVGFPEEACDGPSQCREYVHPKLGISLRTFLQTVGEAIRQKNPMAWVDYAEPRRLAESGMLVLVTDVRHHEEFDALVQCGAITIGIDRPTDRSDTHVSETTVDALLEKCRYRINNDGTLNDLVVSVRSTMRIAGLAVMDTPIPEYFLD